MIGALGARAIGDAGVRELASAWGGAGLTAPGARTSRPGRGPVLRPVRGPTAG